MRHVRAFTALLAMAAIVAACSSPGASSNGGSSQGAGASEPAASTGGGGGGGGGGANGSLHYEITGDVTKSGDLAFTYISGGVSQFTSGSGGWVAYFYSQDKNTIVQINSVPDAGIFNYADGEIVIVGTAQSGCTFNFSQNDASGLKGTVDCQSAITMNSSSGAQVHTNVHATVDAHT